MFCRTACEILSEVLAQLEDQSDTESSSSGINIFLEPPEHVTALTDEDSDKSDEECDGNVNHLSRGILRASCQVQANNDDDVNRNDDDSDSTVDYDAQVVNEPQQKKAKKIPWKPDWINNDVLDTPCQIYHENGFVNSGLKSPLEFFRRFFDHELLTHIVDESNKYAASKNFDLRLTQDELLVVLGGILLSGYSKLPHRRMYWNVDDDVPSLLRYAIRRNRYEDIIRHLHLNDNNKVDDRDRMFKLRPFMSMLQARFRELNTLDENLSIDESMIPYYGKHKAKQFIRGKPIRFGFKNWALCSSKGYMYGFDIYCGKDKDVNYEMGLGADVVVGLLEQVSVPAHSGHKIYFDNFFTTLPLLKFLHENGYYAAGTVRENRLQKCPIKSSNILKKESRGNSDVISCSKVLVVKWNDNSIVSLASNFGSASLGKASRWSNVERKKVLINRPTMFDLYNKGMGGVDQMDQQVACYRSRIRQRKWWWPIFAYLLDVTVVNAWYLRQKELSLNDSLLDFRRGIVVSLLKTYGTASMQGQRIVPPVLNDVRYDGKEHWIVKGLTERRCKQCGKKTIYRCEKCDIGMHPDCHKAYHT